MTIYAPHRGIHCAKLTLRIPFKAHLAEVISARKLFSTSHAATFWLLDAFIASSVGSPQMHYEAGQLHRIRSPREVFRSLLTLRRPQGPEDLVVLQLVRRRPFRPRGPFRPHLPCLRPHHVPAASGLDVIYASSVLSPGASAKGIFLQAGRPSLLHSFHGSRPTGN